jgi:outer membrane protein assembly factor BamB
MSRTSAGLAVCIAVLLPALAGAVWAPSWTRSLESVQPLRGDYVAAAADDKGRFLVATASPQDGAGAGNVRLLLLDSTGARIAESSPDPGSTLRVEQMVSCPIGGWLIAGSTYGDFGRRRFAARVGVDGRSVWMRELSASPGVALVDDLGLASTADCGALVVHRIEDSVGGRSARLASLAATDGKPLWMQVLRAGVGPAADFEGSTAIAVDGDALFVVGRQVSSGEAALARWSVASGQPAWVRGLGVRSAGTASVAAAAGRVWVAVLEAVPGAAPGDAPSPRLFARAAATGDPDWNATEPAAALGEGELSLAVRGLRVAATFGGAVVLREADTGTLLWRTSVPAVRDVSIASDGSVLVRAVTRTTLVGEPSLLRLGSSTGEVQWQLADTATQGRAVAWAIAPGTDRILVLGADPQICCDPQIAGSLTLVSASDGTPQVLAPGSAVRPQAPAGVLQLADGDLVEATAEWSASGARLVLRRLAQSTGIAVWESTVPIPTMPSTQWLAVTALAVGTDGTLGAAARAGDRSGDPFGGAVVAAFSPEDGTVIAQRDLPEGAVGASWVRWSVASVAADAGGGLTIRAGRSIRTGSAERFEVVLRRSLGTVTAWERIDVPPTTTAPILDAGSRLLALVGAPSGDGFRIAALDRATGAVLWTAGSNVESASAVVGSSGGVAHVVEVQPVAPGQSKRLVARTLNLVSGVTVWETTLVPSVPRGTTVTDLALTADGGLIAVALAQGIEVWRLSTVDGQVAWHQGELPIVQAWSVGGGRLVQLDDGRLGVTVSMRMPESASAAPVAFGHLAVLDAATGGWRGLHATLGAQAPGAAGAVDPPLLATRFGPPVFVHRQTDLALGPVSRISALPVPQAVPGVVTLSLSRVVLGDDGRRERIAVRVAYGGSAPSVSLVLRVGASVGVALSDATCVPLGSSDCAAAPAAPSLAIPMFLVHAGSATVVFDTVVAPWAGDRPVMYVGVEGDYAVNDFDIADQLRVETLRGALHADSFE